MANVIYAPGMLVEHPKFGLGKILELRGGKAYIHFCNDTQDSRHLALGTAGLAIAPLQSDPVLDSLPPFRDGRFVTSSKRVDWNDGIEEFLRSFPGGFSDPAYVGTGSKTDGERAYKWKAHELWMGQLGDGRGEELLARGEIDLAVSHALAVMRAVDILGKYEAIALADGLKSEEPARRFLEALFAFVASGPAQATFEQLADALLGLPTKAKGSRVATWPVLTLFPFLADPSRFMFLKPEVTQECAARMRFDLQYDSAPRWITYERLMKLSEVLLAKLKDRGARDYIDVQSFMYVIARY